MLQSKYYKQSNLFSYGFETAIPHDIISCSMAQYDTVKFLRLMFLQQHVTSACRHFRFKLTYDDAAMVMHGRTSHLHSGALSFSSFENLCKKQSRIQRKTSHNFKLCRLKVNR